MSGRGLQRGGPGESAARCSGAVVQGSGSARTRRQAPKHGCSHTPSKDAREAIGPGLRPWPVTARGGGCAGVICSNKPKAGATKVRQSGTGRLRIARLGRSVMHPQPRAPEHGRTRAPPEDTGEPGGRGLRR